MAYSAVCIMLLRAKRRGKVHVKVTSRYTSAVFFFGGGGTPGSIAMKTGLRVAPRDVINISDFCVKISGVSNIQGSKSPFSH